MTIHDPALRATDFESRQLPQGELPEEHASRRRPRRIHTAAFKARIAVAALQGEASVADLSQQFDVHRNQITQWRAQLLERAPELFDAVADKPRRR
jgi:transposase-like protein